jgi:hypothetical protein
MGQISSSYIRDALLDAKQSIIDRAVMSSRGRAIGGDAHDQGWGQSVGAMGISSHRDTSTPKGEARQLETK